MAKMWAGRTDGATEKIADDFNSSIRFDCRMYRQDITGSMAHAAMLAAKHIITEADADALIAGLEQILADLENGALEIDMECEDIHMFVEQVLTQRIGDVGKKLRIYVALLCRLIHVLFIDFHYIDYLNERLNAEFHRLYCIKQRLLVFLDVLVVCERHSLQSREQ